MKAKCFLKWFLTLCVVVVNTIVLLFMSFGMALNDKYLSQQPWESERTVSQLKAELEIVTDTSASILIVAIFSLPVCLAIVLGIHKALK
ncbi:hypothetical protein AB7Y49_05365 [Providencia vermicola]|uniref:Uncharacterized protein n=1 Tax=Providencia vermicola TaxID=333965 RepID=A0AAX3RU90_9GAMM|nr:MULTISPECIES: hypothetical protein [Providencia]ELX8378054.1 hypothetical protein [Providencia stuartii]EMD5259506.1 hypothetical protein [Providencia stuartii]USB36034.1 hypothetical protein M5J11_14605 [Providencia vermicola]WFC05134.1 hypothetical protein PG365_10290 [Providencia vermicola]